MAADDILCAEFMDWDLDTSTCNADGVKQEKQLSAPQRRCYSLCKRKSFSAFVASKRDDGREPGSPSWRCCGQSFERHSAFHKHAARTHHAEIARLTQTTYENLLRRLEEEAEAQQPNEREANPADVLAWIPETAHFSEEQLRKYCSNFDDPVRRSTSLYCLEGKSILKSYKPAGPGKVLLYYRYCLVEDPHVICAWQKALCEKLHLTGKVRLATEGINGTVGGTNTATRLYVDAMRAHPLFKMEEEDFKTSEGGAECFKDMTVGVYKEIVPMGMDPDVLSYQLAGVHLEPEEFHKEVQALLAKGDLANDTVLLDCRNFYESKIGQFTQCLAPSIRKFSYFPDYVDHNLDLFRDKKVLMYCTGGIRCERGSAYLRSKDVCKEVYQLKGGIHKYLERFPEGFYRGKLFVFDERYAISSNNDVISDCRYCGCPWDRYQLCSTEFCCQLVLSCPACRRDGRTACCPTCRAKGGASHRREECECTDGRPRIPRDA